ncbi:MAG: DotH/IcmK family type IV secretion protein [bacterium]|nr:DotH/IcmK family type IV secretion protein [bacterium]
MKIQKKGWLFAILALSFASSLSQQSWAQSQPITPAKKANSASDPSQPIIPSANQGQSAGISNSSSGAVPLVPVMPTKEFQYESAKAQIFPVSPEQIRGWQETVDQQRRAARAKIITVPKISSDTLDLSPGAAPPGICVSPFFGATINFIDASGNPWPIKAVTEFNKDDFKSDKPFPSSNTLTISNLGSYGQGSVTVFLDGFDTPIVLMIYGGQKVTDTRKDLRVPRQKPGVINPIPARTEARAANVDRRLFDLLDGIIPAGSVSLVTSDPLVRAWQLDDKLIIRTAATIMNTFDERVPSQDGTFVYSMPLTPLVAVSVNGIPRTVSIEF